MGKKKTKSVYNDYLDGEKLHDNVEPRTLLQDSTLVTHSSIPPTPTVHATHASRSTRKATARSQNPPLTHFLCLPLVNPTSLLQFQHALEQFKKDLRHTNTPIPPEAVRPASTLHLTLGVMSLDDSQLGVAISRLRALDLHSMLCDSSPLRASTASEHSMAARHSDTDALTVDMVGLLPMHKPQDTSVLYADPKDESARLDDFARRIKKAMEDVGGLGSDTRPLKLHATVVNTIYAVKAMRTRARAREKADTRNDHERGPQEVMQSHSVKTGRALRFDARDLMDRYQGFVWAKDVKIDKVCICKMGARKKRSSSVEGPAEEVAEEAYEVVAEKAIFA